jgi:hypothetical protein
MISTPLAQVALEWLRGFLQLLLKSLHVLRNLRQLLLRNLVNGAIGSPIAARFLPQPA